ncbi:hypothetical protein PISMIDRAFT_571770 [Pisolithus microcarpus 441]|uniref:Uncharacterized protein n=1 Tax=Pisolithus microcarpus 441 TaxID=765257 RepID=A0A0C9YVU9_9AGAM|nr:hypothetical protein PISMIDRAFT_571770 [Pisolithus microcarpus 441]
MAATMFQLQQRINVVHLLSLPGRPPRNHTPGLPHSFLLILSYRLVRHPCIDKCEIPEETPATSSALHKLSGQTCWWYWPTGSES